EGLGGSGRYLEPKMYLPVDLDAGKELTQKGWLRRQKQLENRNKLLEVFNLAIQRPEIFIRHHLAKGHPVPFWALVEVLSFGDFSRLLRGLREGSPIRKVPDTFEIHEVRQFTQAVQ